MQWDLFCRVVDNFGDIGVCWRLAPTWRTRRTVRLSSTTSALAGWRPGRAGVQVAALARPDVNPATW
jgi:hypothetical protein